MDTRVDATTSETRTNSRVEATTPVTVAHEISTTNGRVLSFYFGTSLTVIFTNAEISGIYNTSSSKGPKVLFRPIPTLATT